MAKKGTLIVIGGPTAVGKTSVAIELAKHFGCEIISADSRQFYKEMNVGTAKPDEQELTLATHHFINSHSIEEDYNVGKFEEDVLELLDKLFEQNKTVILVGGSGLYLKAVCEGLDELPSAEVEHRNQLNELDLLTLQNELKEADPEYYEVVDLNNKQRLVRALEVYRSSGKPFSSFRKGKSKERPFNIVKVALEMDREILHQRIDERMDLMLSNGLVDEAKSLSQFQHLNALQTVGYSEVFGFLNGEYDKDEMIRLLKRNSRRYAKRQLTWLRRDHEFNWFDPKNLEEIKSFVETEISKSVR